MYLKEKEGEEKRYWIIQKKIIFKEIYEDQGKKR